MVNLLNFVLDDDPLSGKMVLHKGNGRDELQFFYFSTNFDDLRKILADPQVELTKRISAEAKMDSPVTGILKPFKEDIKPITDKLYSLAMTKARESGSNSKAKLSTKKDFRAGLADWKKGWFLAEFANLTGLLHIYYLSPTDTTVQQYKAGFSPFVVCSLGKKSSSSISMCQIHFDLNTKPDGSDLDKLRADFIVDYLQDKGKSICNHVDGHVDMEHTQLSTVLKPGSADPEKGKFVPGHFKTKAMNGLSQDGPTLIVEKLSTKFPKGTVKDPVQYFVCSQSSGTFTGEFAETGSTASVEMGDTTLKIYSDPPH